MRRKRLIVPCCMSIVMGWGCDCPPRRKGKRKVQEISPRLAMNSLKYIKERFTGFDAEKMKPYFDVVEDVLNKAIKAGDLLGGGE